MTVYLDLLILLNFALNYALLTAVARITGAHTGVLRLGAGAAVGAGYAAMTVLPGFTFLGGNLWRGVFLCLMAVTAFGVRKETIKRGVLLLLMSFLLGGVALGLRLRGFWPLLAAAGALAALSAFLLRDTMEHAGQLVPVKITYGEKQVELTALRDTGNTLKDPFTGEPVLVVQPETAQTLLGTVDLRQPAQVVEHWTGRGKPRLIPYHAIGGSGMLLALRCDRVTVAGRPAGGLVAFSPEKLSATGTYQALTGGGQYG